MEKLIELKNNLVADFIPIIGGFTFALYSIRTLIICKNTY